jgi:hypothetical protein
MSILRPFQQIEWIIKTKILEYNRIYYQQAINNAFQIEWQPFSEEQIELIICDIDLQLTRNVYNSFSRLDTNPKWVRDLPNVNDYSEDERVTEVFNRQWIRTRRSTAELDKYIHQELRARRISTKNTEIDLIKYEYYKIKLNREKFIAQWLQTECPFKSMILQILRPIYRYLKSQE